MKVRMDPTTTQKVQAYARSSSRSHARIIGQKRETPRNANAHSRGFSLTEVIILISVLSIALMISLQVYFDKKLKEPLPAQSSISALAVGGNAAGNPLSAAGRTSSSSNGTEVELMDDSMPAGAPDLGGDSSALVIQFGTGDTMVSMNVPGQVDVVQMEYGTKGETTPIHVFYME